MPPIKSRMHRICQAIVWGQTGHYALRDNHMQWPELHA